MELHTLIEKFSDQASCISYLENIRWNNSPTCPYCNACKSSALPKELRHKCRECNRSFSVLVGTIFHNSRLPLFKWFWAIHLISGAKKGISSLQLARHLNINKDTALYLQRRIREAMKEDYILEGIVEADETYVGGSMAHMNFKRKKKLMDQGFYRGGMEHKTPVLGMFNREKNKVTFKVLKKAHGKEIQPILRKNITPNSVLVTDGFGAYSSSHNFFDNHVKLNHEKKIYKSGKFNTSTIESLWTIVKRAVYGIYHNISEKYLDTYLREIQFKFNNQKENIFNILTYNLLMNPIPINGL